MTEKKNDRKLEELNQDRTEVLQAVEKKPEIKGKLEAMAYIGPDIPGVIKQFTVYNNGLPEEFKQKVKTIPALKNLMIPVSKLAVSNEQVKKPGTALFILYQQVTKSI